jgi:hypothetical protein
MADTGLLESFSEMSTRERGGGILPDGVQQLESAVHRRLAADGIALGAGSDQSVLVFGPQGRLDVYPLYYPSSPDEPSNPSNPSNPSTTAPQGDGNGLVD